MDWGAYSEDGKTVDNDGEVRYNKSKYNEFNTLAMQWAYADSTNTGDTKVLNRNGKEFVLIEATDNGYVELYSNKNYERVKEVKREFKSKTDTIYEYIATYRNGQNNYNSNNNDVDGNAKSDSEYGQGSRQVGRKGLQSDSTTSTEHLQSSNKRGQAGLENSAFSIGEETDTEYLQAQIQEQADTDTVIETAFNNAIENNTVNKTTAEKITDRLASRAVNKRIETEQQNEIAKKTRQSNGNYVKANIVTELDGTQQNVKNVFEKNGIRTVWFNNASIVNESGKKISNNTVNGFTEGNTIYLNADLPLDKQVFKHEYTHTLEKAEGYKEFANRVKNSKAFKNYILAKHPTSKTFGQAFSKEQDSIRQKQSKLKNLSNTQIKYEMVADFVEDRLFNAKNSYEGLKQIEKAYGNDKKGFKRFLDWLKTFIAKFKDAFNIRHPIKSSTTTSSIMKLEKNIVELQKEIDEGKTVDNDGEVRYNKSKYNEFNTLAMQWAY
ncbi:MAG: hypothetical protein IJO19_02325, partial [Clostridia bacterium]|nr:hypothetical protein [Clostridia bacterium]